MPYYMFDITMFFSFLVINEDASIKSYNEYIDKYINEEEFFLPELPNIALSINNLEIYITNFFKEKNISNNSLIAKIIYTYFIFLVDEEFKMLKKEINVDLTFFELYEKYLNIKSKTKRKKLKGNFSAYFIQIKSCNRSIFKNYISREKLLYESNLKDLILHAIKEYVIKFIGPSKRDEFISYLQSDLKKIGISDSDLDKTLTEDYMFPDNNIIGFDPDTILIYLKKIGEKMK